jgi:hypothetical protein
MIFSVFIVISRNRAAGISVASVGYFVKSISLVENIIITVFTGCKKTAASITAINLFSIITPLK